MLNKFMAAALILLGIAGIAAGGVLLTYQPVYTVGGEWAIGIILAALAYMITYGLTQIQQC